MSTRAGAEALAGWDKKNRAELLTTVSGLK